LLDEALTRFPKFDKLWLMRAQLEENNNKNEALYDSSWILLVLDFLFSAFRKSLRYSVELFTFYLLTWLNAFSSIGIDCVVFLGQYMPAE
jgi:hypothetical protein